MTSLLQHKITDHKDNPIIAALITFVTDTLSRSPDDISNYEVIQHMPESGAAEFSVRFGDGSEGYTGTIRQGLDGWHVSEYRLLLIASGISPTIHSMLSGKEIEQMSELITPRQFMRLPDENELIRDTEPIRTPTPMTYQEKCSYIAAHAKPEPVTAEEVHEQITQALTHPVLDLFLTAEELADATIRKIKMEEAK